LPQPFRAILNNRKKHEIRVTTGTSARATFNSLSSHACVDFYQLATIYAGLGEKDEAFRLLGKGYEFSEHALSLDRPALIRDAL
jgi:hypothetical protein